MDHRAARPSGVSPRDVGDRGALGPGRVAGPAMAGLGGPLAEADVEVIPPDLSDPVADYRGGARGGPGLARGCARLGGPGRAGPDGGDRGRRPVAVDAGPRGAAGRPGAAARGGGPARRRDDQRRGRPAPRRGRRGDAPAGRRRGRGRLPLLQPAGGRPLGLRRPGRRSSRESRCGSSGRWPRPTCGS